MIEFIKNTDIDILIGGSMAILVAVMYCLYYLIDFIEKKSKHSKD